MKEQVNIYRIIYNKLISKCCLIEYGVYQYVYNYYIMDIWYKIDIKIQENFILKAQKIIIYVVII